MIRRHPTRSIAAGFVALVVVTTATLIGLQGHAMATETPEYQIERSDGAVEIRQYGARIVAEITVSGDRREAANRAFTPLANYIFAKERAAPGETIAMTSPVTQSRAGEKIAMTAPATQSTGPDGKWTVQFIMPASYTMETLPAPGRADVRLETVSPQRMAVIRFSGHPTDANVARHEKELIAWMERKGIRPSGAPVYAYYDAPFKPGFLRRNEVMVPIGPPNADRAADDTQ